MKKSVLSLLFALICGQMWAQVSIEVHLSEAVKQPLQGRLYLFTATDTTKGVQDPNPFQPTPTFYLDVKGWQGGEVRRLSTNATGYPHSLSDLKPGFYKFAALLDVDTLERNNTLTPGNWYSRDVVAEVKSGEAKTIQLHLQRQVPIRPFRETQFLKLVEMRSALVSTFRKRDIWLKGAVILPQSYFQDSTRHFPLVLVIPGWGGTHYDAGRPDVGKRYGFGTGKDKIYVYLNPEVGNPYGLHAFVDSRVTGPWGKALVEEFIPQLLQKYRIKPEPSQHFVMGQSSGGYGALWLQLNYPDSFGGCWAVSPDPIDFSDFTSVDLYARQANFFYDQEKKERPFFLLQGQYLTTMRQFVQFEQFMGDGGQTQSFEAAFGLPAPDGRPQELFDRQTGVVSPRIFKTWQPYDLARYLQRHAARLRTQLDGKIHIYAGADDNFFLQRSVLRFKEHTAALPFKITVGIQPNADHWTIWSTAMTQLIQAEIDSKIH